MSQSIRVSFGQKVAFGLGMLANQMFPAVLGIFMVVLVKDLGFQGWQWSLIYFLPRIFDSFTDPIMGFISDNTKSKWGRRRQYVIAGALLMGVAFVIMWQLYRENSVQYNFTYFMLWSFVFYLGLTIFSVPYVAMGYEMSEDFHERTEIMAIAQWIGQWAWVIAPWFWVIMYDPAWFPLVDEAGNKVLNESGDLLADPARATRTLAIWVGVVCMLFAMVPGIFLKSKSTVNENYAPLTIKNIGGSLLEILDGFKEAFKSAPFRRLCGATFLIFNAFNTVAAFSFFIVVYYLFNGDATAAGKWPTLFGSLGALITTFAVIPTVAWMSKKMEKKQAFLVSQGISVFGYILLWFLFIPGKPWMFIFALPFFSFGIGSLFTLMMSMTADVIDLDELRTGKRREGVFGAIYWWMVKFGFAIAGGLSGLILTFVGFDSTPGAEQTEESIRGLRIFFSVVPIVGTVLAIIIMWGYKISEERANEIRSELEKRKSSKPVYRPGVLNTFPNIQLPAFSGINIVNKSLQERKEIVLDMLRSKVHGLSFSPYVEGQGIGDVLSEEQIRRRMDIITPHIKWVRSFSCSDGNELIPQIAKKNGLKTMVGVWLSDDLERNQVEITTLIDLAKKGLVDIAAVGNEVLLRNELSEEQIIEYLAQVKREIPTIKVSYVDTYYELYMHSKILEYCDVVLANCYPFWEGSSIDYSLEHLRKMHAAIKTMAPNKKVIIAETGWPTNGEVNNGANPTMENASAFFIEAHDWAEKEEIDLFYFSSFDESWKMDSEGSVGAHWGIWNKNEQLKYKL